MKEVERVVGAVFGVFFIVTCLVLAIKYPSPTVFQYNVFSVVLAFAAAGMAIIIPGTINLEIPKLVKAGGAMAVIVLVFLFSPAKYIAEKPESDSWKEQSVDLHFESMENGPFFLRIRGDGKALIAANEANIYINAVDIFYPGEAGQQQKIYVDALSTYLECKKGRVAKSSRRSRMYKVAQWLSEGGKMSLKNIDFKIERPNEATDISQCVVVFDVDVGDGVENSHGNVPVRSAKNTFN